ncbi:MAG: 3-dehydroquinate synthase [FCB group bacterium]|nr:3-dehydroquinate synthase [FCB group bacterium]
MIIPIKLGSRSYPVHLDTGLRYRFPELTQHYHQNQKWVLVTQRSLATLAHSVILDRFVQSGYNMSIVFVGDGESAKSLSQMEALYDRLVALNCDRSTILVSFGGGVVGDITGFAAATFLRGIRYIQVPTTLLAMVDSAIGGKTGINLRHGKNLVGSIYQPVMVLVDPELLESLSLRDRVSGLGEVIKYGAIRDVNFLEWLNQNLVELIQENNWPLFQETIDRSVRIKGDIVARDELEGDLRRLLNFGHTIGHALETTAGYGFLRHGEAVALGMLAAGEISVNKGLLPFKRWIYLKDIIHQCPLPDVPEVSEAEFLLAIKKDKKMSGGKVHMILLEDLGKPVIN